MEKSSNALEAIQRRGYQASVYPTNHADIHMGDVVFFKIGDALQEHLPQESTTSILGSLTTILSLVTKGWLTCLRKVNCGKFDSLVLDTIVK
ncbi:hypothetical protein DSO57_1024693 [Entomophthora muscae]|uniref:Uncharacterized protein n=1 Tax=Entomophthora muscae TaxID=34485 RepID=A0ACC2TPW0_9FUNG|nr:hypothetical protein DSO57_1024693 [Entomophthora muscae]